MVQQNNASCTFILLKLEQFHRYKTWIVFKGTRGAFAPVTCNTLILEEIRTRLDIFPHYKLWTSYLAPKMSFLAKFTPFRTFTLNKRVVPGGSP